MSSPPVFKAATTKFNPVDPPCYATVMSTWLSPGIIAVDFSGFGPEYSKQTRVLHRFFWINDLDSQQLKTALDSLTVDYREPHDDFDLSKLEGQLIFNHTAGWGYYWKRGEDKWICRGPMSGFSYNKEQNEWIAGSKSDLIKHIVGLAYLSGLITQYDPILRAFQVTLELE